MKKEHVLIAYMLIGLGMYFLIKQLNLDLFSNFYSYTTIIIIVGISFILHSYTVKEYNNLFSGIIISGFGIHLHGIENYAFWFNHWSMYVLIIGIAFIVRYLKTKSGLLTGIILISFALFMIFSIKIPSSLHWIYGIIGFVETFWPVALIILGIYLLKFKK